MTTTHPAPSGAELRERRVAIGISRQKVAELARCSLSHLGAIEKGFAAERSSVTDRVVAVLEDLERAAAERVPR